MKLIPFLSQSKSLDSSSPPSTPWPFPSCGNIKTLSFRAPTSNFYKDDNFRTFNSAYLDTTDQMTNTTPDSFTVSSSSRSFSTMSDDISGDPIESVIRGLRSDRLFFEPEQSCSLVLRQNQHKTHKNKKQLVHKQQEPVKKPDPGEDGWVEEEECEVVYKESEAMSMDSSDPCEDFRRSMEEMVEAHGLKDWQGLEELLGCYLKINAKVNHGYIMGAFIDLLVTLSFVSSSSNTTTNTTSTNTTTTSSNSLSSSTTNLNNFSSPSSPLSLPSSSLTTPSLSSLLDHGDDHDHHDDDHNDVDNEVHHDDR